MNTQGKNFKRVEKKYLLNRDQHSKLMVGLENHMVADEYGLNTITSMYYDTPDFKLIRKSLDKPIYKEKLRLRSYGVPEDGTKVFMELKKKYKGVVYKRRETMTYKEAMNFFDAPKANSTQIEKELYWCQKYHHIKPMAIISYDRQAYFGKCDPDFRITIDQNLRGRTTNLDLREGSSGQPIIDSNRYLMEVKVAGAFPLYLVHLFDELEIYPTSFSKYGTYYNKYVCSENQFSWVAQLVENQARAIRGVERGVAYV